MSQRLKLSEVRDVFRLLGELRDRGNDAMDWRHHMVERLAGLVGAQVGICTETREIRAADVRPVGIVDAGWTGIQQRAAWERYVAGGRIDPDPTAPFIMTRLARPFTSCRHEMADDGTWYRSDHVQIYRRSSDVDHFIFSYRPLKPSGSEHFIYLLRPWGDRPFEQRQRRLVHIFHQELARILDDDAVRSRDAAPKRALPPRLRETLDGLTAGEGEKQIAARLGLSRHTVHEYIKALHRRFDASNRAELLAHVASQRPAFRPRLVAWNAPPESQQSHR